MLQWRSTNRSVSMLLTRELQEKWSNGKGSEEQLFDEFYPRVFSTLGKALESKQDYGELYKEARRKGHGLLETSTYVTLFGVTCRYYRVPSGRVSVAFIS